MVLIQGFILSALNYAGTAAQFVTENSAAILAAGLTLANVKKAIDKSRAAHRASQDYIIAGSKRGQAFGDVNLVSNQKRNNPLYVSLGRKIPQVDSVKKFLSHLSGSGQVTSSWAGEMKSVIGQRNYHYEFFRHRLAKDSANVIPSDYPITAPTIYNPTILLPTSLAVQYTSASLTNYPFQFKTGFSYYAPLNRADYEDMSWNLNKLKLGGSIYNQGYTGIIGDDIVDYSKVNYPLFQPFLHRKQSNLQQNNAYCASNFLSPPAANNKMTEQPYIYDMHFKSGTVSYEFMNKGASGAIIELIVYRVKKNKTLPANVDKYTNSDALPIGSVVTSNWESVLGQGYVQTATDKFGTDDLRGRDPVESDILTNPDYPFLKEYSKCKKADIPFHEMSRHSLSLTSGSRKEVTIALPGDVYNPCDIPRLDGFPITPARNAVSALTPDVVNGYSWDYDSASIPLVDQHSYMIVISTTGEKLSRIVTKDNPVLIPDDPVTTVMLDEYCPSLVQYYCTYSEEIGAAVYSDKLNKKLFVRGTRRIPELVDPEDEFTLDTGLILELANGVQQAANVVKKLNAAGAPDGAEVTSGGDIILTSNR